MLNLDVPREACPLNLAPTASTTAALAIGDPLAAGFMRMNEMSEEDSARHHPGGQLGKRLLLRVDDVMRKGDENPIVDSEQSVREMLVAITAFRVGGISVVDKEGKLLGLVTDYEIRKALEGGDNIAAMSIVDIMNKGPETVLPEVRASDAWN